jgi:hypothetical protein
MPTILFSTVSPWSTKEPMLGVMAERGAARDQKVEILGLRVERAEASRGAER